MSITSDQTILIGADPFWVQNASRPWSLTVTSDSAYRFEVRPEDQFARDPDYKERSEVCGNETFTPSETVTVNYSFMIEMGAANTADWLVLAQFHADDPVTSPPLAIEMIGEKMAVAIRYPVGDGYKTNYVFIDEQDIQRGKYYDIVITAKFENSNSGFVDVWRDGQQIVDYNGPVGYGYGVYWKNGVYRAESKETLAVNFKGLTLSVDGGVVIVGTEGSDKVTGSTSPAGQPPPTNKGDLIDLKGSNDVVVAGDGDDIIVTGRGKDRVNAGSGNDHIYAADNNDWMKGGPGHDVFAFSGNFGEDSIEDFTPNVDKIMFVNIFNDFENMMDYAHSTKGGTVIEYLNSTITLCNIKIADLGENDFIFT